MKEHQGPLEGKPIPTKDKNVCAGFMKRSGRESLLWAKYYEQLKEREVEGDELQREKESWEGGGDQQAWLNSEAQGSPSMSS